MLEIGAFFSFATGVQTFSGGEHSTVLKTPAFVKKFNNDYSGKLFLPKESLTPQQIIGPSLIMSGIFLMARECRKFVPDCLLQTSYLK